MTAKGRDGRRREDLAATGRLGFLPGRARRRPDRAAAALPAAVHPALPGTGQQQRRRKRRCFPTYFSCIPAEVDRVHDLSKPHAALLALVLVLPRAAAERAPCTKRKTHPSWMSHSRSESAGQSQNPLPVTARSCCTAQVPQPQAARLVTSPLMVSSRGKVTPVEEPPSNLR